ncbi:MAG: putative cytokinetic ring protein SteA [Acidimicrobiia bacterium]
MKMRESAAVICGRVRRGRRTKELVKALGPGEIAVIAHADLDRVAADALVDAGVVAVVNTQPSITGRYPNGGPMRLIDAGIALYDVDAAVFDQLHDGETLSCVGSELRTDAGVVIAAQQRTADDVHAAMEAARGTIGAEIERFAINTLEYITHEGHVLFAPVAVPELEVDLEGRHALVVVRGHDYREDLKVLRPYIREYQPVLIAVDGGADALLEQGLRPDIIIGDFDSVSERAVHCGATLVHHVHLDGRAPGREQLLEWGVPYVEFVADGMSEDVAMLLANECGAALIVAVGTHATMVEFLDKGRKGMASTFLTRLRLGPVLVDAKGVGRLYAGRVRRRDIAFLVVAALIAMIAVSIVSEPIHIFLNGIRLTLRDLWFSISDWL